jgi:outer membrane receptor for ferrienterochelin and colicins
MNNIRIILTHLFLLGILTMPYTVNGQDCRSRNEKAQELHENGQFKEAIELVLPITISYCGADEKILAYRLLANSYLEIDSMDLAKRYVYELLTINSTYTPDRRDSRQFAEFVIKESFNFFRNKISSVSKKAEDPKLAPAAISILTEEVIKRRGYQDVEAILHDLSGFDISRSNGLVYSNIYQRGYRSATNTDRTLILVDGFEDNSLVSGTAFISRQYALSNIKRMEVIYGPSSTMYGANAFAGVVNIVTKDAFDIIEEGNFGATATVGGGQWNTKYLDMTTAFKNDFLSFTVTGRFFKSDEMDLSTYGGYSESGYDNYWDQTFNSGGRFNTDFYRDKFRITSSVTDNYNSLLAITNSGPLYNLVVNGNDSAIVATPFAANSARALDSINYANSDLSFKDPTDDWYLAGKLNFKDVQFGVQSWQRKEGAFPAYVDDRYASGLAGSSWTASQTMFYMTFQKLRKRFSFSNLTRFKLNETAPDVRLTSYSSYSNGTYDLLDLANGVTPNWDTSYFYQISKQFRSEFKAFYRGRKYDLLAGAEFRMSTISGNFLTSSQEFPELFGTVPSVDGGDNYNPIEIGGYLQSTYTPIDSVLQLSVAGRFDNSRNRDLNNNVFNPRVAIVYTPRKKSGESKGENHFIFKAIHSQAFKEASLFQKFNESSTRLRNPGLRPEKAKNFELSGRWSPHKDFSFEAILYRTAYSNIIVERTIALGEDAGKTQYVNEGKIEILGVQANLNYTIRRYDLYANYTYADPYNSYEDKIVGDIAPHQINLGVNGAFYYNKINVNLRTNYVAAKPTGINTTTDENPLNEIPGYFLLNGAVSYTQGSATLQVVVNNILNSFYYHPGVRGASGATYAPILPQPTQNFHIRLTLDLK